MGTDFVALRFRNSWHKIRQDQFSFKGKVHTYTFMEQPGCVFIVPITKARELVLIKMYRYTVDDWCLEVPAGMIIDKLHLPLEEIAKEEMQEEAGCFGGTIRSLGSFYSANGVLDLRAHYFFAEGVECGGQRKPEELECITEVIKVPLDEVKNWIFSGKINDGDSAFAIMLALGKLGLG